MSTKFFVSLFFPKCPIPTKLCDKLQLGTTKNAGSTNLLFLLQKKIRSLKVESGQIFSLKMGQNSMSSWSTICVVKIEGLVTPRFFCRSQLYFISKISRGRLSRKKKPNKIHLVFIRAEKLRFLESFSKSRILIVKFHLVSGFSKWYEKKNEFLTYFDHHSSVTGAKIRLNIWGSSYSSVTLVSWVSLATLVQLVQLAYLVDRRC